MKTIYVACGLTKASEDFIQFVTDFKKQLTLESGTHILEFVGLVNGSAADVYNTDCDNVRDCDAVIAIVDEPSIGLGMEIQLATSLNNPVLCIHQQDNKITRMILGAESLGILSVAQYTDLSSAVSTAAKFLKKLA